MFDLPFVLGTTLESLPAPEVYLPRLAATEETNLAPFSGMKIGIAWCGGTAHMFDVMRSLSLQMFLPLAETPNVKLYSFVRDKRPGEAELLLANSAIEDLSPRIKNFADTARFVSQMDLVITCDTSLAHLAGGMGKKVWTLLPFAPDWRWMLDREDSPWYPTMRLFRQNKSGDWANVIARVQAELRAYAAPSKDKR